MEMAVPGARFTCLQENSTCVSEATIKRQNSLFIVVGVMLVLGSHGKHLWEHGT
jgi:hypothetical protein